MISNIFLGKTNLSVTNALIEKLKNNYSKNKSARHIFLVPDRVSVLTEVKIFEALKIDSTISIEVLTISRLASKILANKSIISKNASCMLIEKIIKQNKDVLKCFNKTISSDLSTNIYEVISQFKSCRISFDEVLVNNKDQILKDKLFDIAFIYKCYQNFLTDNNLLDSLDRLDTLLQNLNKNEYISNSFFYVCNFDGFTFQGFQLINEICKNCYEFNIGVLDSDNLVNEHIYNKSFLEKIKKILSFNSKPNLIYCKDVEVGDFAHLRDNLFGFNLNAKKTQGDSITLFEEESFEKEVLFCASNIKNLMILKNYSFKDFVVVVPNLKDNYLLIEKIFNEYGFNFYLDVAEEFENSVLIRFIKNLCDLIQENYSKTSVLSFVKNPLFNVDRNKIEDFEDVLNKFNIKTFYDLKNFNFDKIENFENFLFVKNALLEKTEDFRNFVLEEEKTFEDFVVILQELLIKLNVPELLQEEVKNLCEENNLKLAKLYEQYYEELCDNLIETKNVLKGEKCNFDLFVSTFLAGIKNISLSTTPISTNAIFVGDSSLSFFDKSKVYFILQIQEDVFPKVLGDCGIISDKEIEALSENYLLEPSIKEINFKERFKAFDTLLKAEDKLFLSCNYSSKGVRGKIIEDVSKLFSVEVKNGFDSLPILNFNLTNIFVANNNAKTAYKKFADEFSEYISGFSNNKKNMSILFNALELKKEDLDKFYFKNEIKTSTNLFFLKNKVSVSEIESFMTCPFLHFCNFGLRLKNKENGEIDAINIGLILHAVAENFLKRELPLNENRVEQIGKNIFGSILKNEDFENLKINKENNILFKNLEKEAIRLCFALNYQAKNNKFKPIYFEAKFNDKNCINSISFKVGNKKIDLIGQIDRVDSYNKFFRIIDYKTGSCDTSLKELYFGKKVQLNAYLKVVEESLKLTPSGAYYFPIKSSFDEDEKENEKYKLKGYTLENFDVIDASDVRFLEEGYLTSDLIEVKFLKNSKEERKLSGRTKVISLDEINLRGEYALNLIQKACSDILKLDITPNPLIISGKDPCKSCKYFGFCKFNEHFGNVKRNPEIKVNKSIATLLKGEEDNEQV